MEWPNLLGNFKVIGIFCIAPAAVCRGDFFGSLQQ